MLVSQSCCTQHPHLIECPIPVKGTDLVIDVISDKFYQVCVSDTVQMNASVFCETKLEQLHEKQNPGLFIIIQSV